MDRIAYINGNFIAESTATISIFDRGFLFGDSVYEVLPVYDGHPYFVERHIARLERSLTSAKIMMPALDWSFLFKELITLNGGGDLQIYLQISRGNQHVRKHEITAGITPTVVAFTLHTPYPTLAAKQQGLHANLVDDIRWLRCDIKTTAMLANVLLHDEAVSNGADTALLIREGYLTEGSTSNVFIVDARGIVRTPPQNNLSLPGITREITIELIQKLGWPFAEEEISQASLINAQEIWITSTTKEIYPITQINSKKIGAGFAGPYWQQINEQYQQLIK